MSDSDHEETTDVFHLDELRQAIAHQDRCTLVMLEGPNPGAVYPIQQAGMVIGRGSKADLRVEDSALSRKHARVFHDGENWMIEDLGSTNGTRLQGSPVSTAEPIKDGARLRIGRGLVFRVALQSEDEQRTTHQVYESSVKDPLTDLYNRRYLDDRLESEFAYAQRHKTNLSIMMVDIDHFKKVNDTYGHQAGDATLRVVAATLTRMVRAEDEVARFGGEEFAVIARGISGANARIMAERIRLIVSRLSIPWENQKISVTVSAGIATYREGANMKTLKRLIQAADEALYAAKNGGRNQVVVA